MKVVFCRQRELLFNNLHWIYSNILTGEAGYFLTGLNLWYIPLLALSSTVVNKAKAELTDLNKLQCSNSFDEQTTMKVSHFLDNGTLAKFFFILFAVSVFAWKRKRKQKTWCFHFTLWSTRRNLSIPLKQTQVRAANVPTAIEYFVQWFRKHPGK